MPRESWEVSDDLAQEEDSVSELECQCLWSHEIKFRPAAGEKYMVVRNCDI